MGSFHQAVWFHPGSQAWQNLYNTWWTISLPVLNWGWWVVALCSVWWDGWAYASSQEQARNWVPRSPLLFDLFTNDASRWAQGSQLLLGQIQVLVGYVCSIWRVWKTMVFMLWRESQPISIPTMIVSWEGHCLLNRLWFLALMARRRCWLAERFCWKNTSATLEATAS